MVNKNSSENIQQKINVDIDPTKVQILYTDSVFVSSNEYGVVLDVAQHVGPQNQTVVARIGMSREHARVLLDVLGKHLALTTSNPKKQ